MYSKLPTDLFDVEARPDVHEDHVCRCEFAGHVEGGGQGDEDGGA